jgi:hypothetical protein
MHSCYSLCTNEVLNLAIIKSQSPIKHELPMVSNVCYQLKQMSREILWMSWMGINTPNY